MGGVTGRLFSAEARKVDIEGLLAIIFIFGIPSVALATHLVIRPLVRDLVGARGNKVDAKLEGRVGELEDVVQDLDRQMYRLLEAERFRRELEAGPKARGTPPEF